MRARHFILIAAAVDGPAHRALAREIAERSVTLLRDRNWMVPLRLCDAARVAVVAPVPVDLTPAETASYLRLGLANALRDRGLRVDEFVAPLDPTPAQCAALAFAVRAHDLVVVGTSDAVGRPGQAGLVRALVGSGRPCIAVALRGPWDFDCYPEAPTCAATYGIQQPQVEALADALLGRIPFRGRLPVSLEVRA